MLFQSLEIPKRCSHYCWPHSYYNSWMCHVEALTLVVHTSHGLGRMQLVLRCVLCSSSGLYGARIRCLRVWCLIPNVWQTFARQCLFILQWNTKNPEHWVYETENLQKCTVSITDCLQNAYVHQLSGMTSIYIIKAGVTTLMFS